MKKAQVLLELLITFSIMLIMTAVIMFAYKSIILRVSLNNETAYLKRFLEYAQDYAVTYQVGTTWEQLEGIYIVKKETGEVLKKHGIPNMVQINQKMITFQSRLTPDKGVTINVSIGKRMKSIIIDPSTGRIRVAD